MTTTHTDVTLYDSNSSPTPPPHHPQPTHANISYGSHPRNTLDLYLAPRPTLTPLIVFIHGGSFSSGDKSQAASLNVISSCLQRGASFAAINYRFLEHAPIQSILQDTARAIRFLRHNASDYNIHNQRIGAFGDSAGAGAALWLAYSALPGDPDAQDPIDQQPAKLSCCAGSRAQSSYDIREWCAIVGDHPAGQTAESGAYFYHFNSPQDFTTPQTHTMLHSLSMLRLIDAASPPTFLLTTDDLSPATNEPDYLHHPKHSYAIQKRCQRAGVNCTLQLIGDHPVSPAMAQAQFLMEHLGVGP